jgi:hypothetical protein
MNSRRTCLGLTPAVLACVFPGAIGCNEPGPVTDAEARQQALALLLPQRVHIEPFTRVALSPTDKMPSELIVYVRAEDQFGDPVKVAGTFNVELYRFKKASGDPKGERIELWRIEVLNQDDQVRYWDHTAQMYEFRLQIRQLATESEARALKSDKAVLLLTYNTPWGEHLEDEYMLDLRAQRKGLAEAGT